MRSARSSSGSWATSWSSAMRRQRQTNGHGEVIYVQELHEVREVNRGVAELARFGLKPSDLVPAQFGWPAASRRRGWCWRTASIAGCWRHCAS